MLLIVLAIAVSTGVGILAEHRYGGRAGIFSRRALLIVLYVVLPPVTFFNLVDAELGADAGIGIGFALVSLALLGITAWAIGTRLLRLSRPAVGAMICCNLNVNTGYLGFAVVAALIGFDALGQAVAYDILVSAPALLIGCFAVGAAFGDHVGEGVAQRARAFVTRNPPLWAALAALVAPQTLAPEIAVDISRMIVVGLLPLGFFAVGAALAEEADAGTLGFPPALDRPVAATVALRLIAGPALLGGLSAAFIDLPDTYLLLASMPVGINSMIVAHAYGLDLRITAGSIAWSTAVSVIGLALIAPFW